MKSFQVVILPAAERDIREIKRYVVKKFGNATWLETYQTLKSSMTVLKGYPESGTIPEELEDFEIMGYREVVSGANRIIYNIVKQQVVIHLVVDTRRDLKTLLNQRLFRM